MCIRFFFVLAAPTRSRLFTGEIKCSTHRTRIPRKKKKCFGNDFGRGQYSISHRKTQSEFKVKKKNDAPDHTTKQREWMENWQKAESRGKVCFSSVSGSLFYLIRTSLVTEHSFSTWWHRKRIWNLELTQQTGQRPWSARLNFCECRIWLILIMSPKNSSKAIDGPLEDSNMLSKVTYDDQVKEIIPNFKQLRCKKCSEKSHSSE